MRVLATLAVVALATAGLVLPVAAQAPAVHVRLVEDIRSGGGSAPRLLTRAADLVFFRANDGVHGAELWATDGTAQGTHLVRDIHPGEAGSGPAMLTAVGSRVYFTAVDGVHGRELWVSDGTRPGTHIVKDLTRGPAGADITGIVDGGGTAYFDLDHRHLWRTDGTARTTIKVRDFLAVDVGAARWMRGRLYLPADDALWRSDGTATGTKRLSRKFWGIDEITVFRRHIYLRADPPLPPYGGVPQLWWSDGTWAGTRRLGTMLDPTFLTPLGSRLYFGARASETRPARLFGGDGTASGTAPVRPWVPRLLFPFAAAGRLWAVGASSGQMGFDQLWVSDGTADGTTLLRNGDEMWFVHDWDDGGHAAMDGRLWFVATPVTEIGTSKGMDLEIWTSDGTAVGTVKAADINPTGPSSPRDLVRSGTSILFTADDGVHGRELWSLSVS
jgi:ELWxxDGT repeat protein